MAKSKSPKRKPAKGIRKAEVRKQFLLLLNAQDHTQIDAVKAHFNLGSTAATIRFALNQAYRALPPESRPDPKKKE